MYTYTFKNKNIKSTVFYPYSGLLFEECIRLNELSLFYKLILHIVNRKTFEVCIFLFKTFDVGLFQQFYLQKALPPRLRLPISFFTR